MPEDTDRPQDVGRRHGRRGRPSAQTLSLLATYQEAMRGELAACLAALCATKVGLLGDAPPEPVLPLDDARRDRLWDRCIKIARELGAEVDAGPLPDAAPAPGPRRRRVDYGAA